MFSNMFDSHKKRLNKVLNSSEFKLCIIDIIIGLLFLILLTNIIIIFILQPLYTLLSLSIIYLYFDNSNISLDIYSRMDTITDIINELYYQ